MKNYKSFLSDIFKKTIQFAENFKIHLFNKWKAKKIAECFVNKKSDWSYCFTELKK